jgi:hypothetical protein
VFCLVILAEHFQHIPFLLPHLVWECAIDSHDVSSLSRVPISALIDHGSPPVLIDQSLVAFFNDSDNSSHVSLTHWVKLKLHDRNDWYSARIVRAIVAPNLCHPVILGLPFLSHNHIIVNAHDHTAIDSTCMFDLLNPVPPIIPKPKPVLRDLFNKIKAD